MKLQDLIGIGKIVKPHGIHGELILEAIDPVIVENIEEPVFIGIDGLPVPFFIENLTSISSTRFRVAFKWVDTEPKAKILVNSQVYAQSADIYISDEQIGQSPDILVGFKVNDLHHGYLGIITKVLYQNNNPVLEIQHTKAEILVPLHPDLICEFNQKKKLLVIEAPEGLIELYI